MDHRASAVWARMGMQPCPEYLVFAAGYEAASDAAAKEINLMKAAVEDDDKIRAASYKSGVAKGRLCCVEILRLVARDAAEYGMDAVSGLLENVADAVAEGLTPEATLLMLKRRHETRQEPTVRRARIRSPKERCDYCDNGPLQSDFDFCPWCAADVRHIAAELAQETLQEPEAGPGVQPPPAASDDSMERSEDSPGRASSE
jgi:hypothetical protein